MKTNNNNENQPGASPRNTQHLRGRLSARANDTGKAKPKYAKKCESFWAKFSVFGGLFLLLTVSGFAQSVTWTNTTTGSWNDPLNWSGGAVPNAVDVAVTVDNTGATANRSVTVNVSATIGSLTVKGVAAALRSGPSGSDRGVVRCRVANRVRGSRVRDLHV